MTRYSGWRRLSGDSSARPDLLDAGKRLLGYLEEQRRISGVSLQSAQYRAADGSLVRARIVGDMPIIEVRAAEGEGAQDVLEFSGFVTLPRMFGTASANDGELAFGEHAQVILSGKGDPLEWRTGFYDQATVPGTFTGHGFTYSKTLPDGLTLAGNIDWVNADYTLSVNWLGPKMRSLSLATVPWASLNTTRRGPRVYCNGQILVDHSLVDANEKVIGACISTQGGKPRVVYVAYRHDVSDFVGGVPKVYAAPFRVHGTKVVPAAAEDTELLATGTSPIADEYQLWPCFFFNQSGTEGRMIRVFLDTYAVTGIGSALHFKETIVTLNADGTASTAEVDHGQAFPSITGNETATVGPNASNLAEMTFVDDNVPAGTVPPGTYDATYNLIYATGQCIIDDNPANTPKVVVNSGGYDYTMSVAGGPFPIAVDYQDDVPVYLYWTPAAITHNAGVDASWTQSSTASQSQSVTYTLFPDAEEATYPSANEGAHHLEVAADGLTDASATDSLTGGRLHAVDKDGVAWLDLAYSKESTESANGSASLSQAWDRSYSNTYDPDGTPTSGSETTSASTHFSSTLTRDHVIEEKWPQLWWLDMRSRSAAYSLYTQTTHEASTATTTADAESTPPGAEPDFPTAAAHVVTDVTADSVSGNVDTRVVFDATEVEAVTSSWSDDTSTDTDATGAAREWDVSDVLSFRFSVDAASNLTATDRVPVTLLSGAWGSTDLGSVAAGFDLSGGSSPSDLSQTADLPALGLPRGIADYLTFKYKPTDTTIDKYDSFIYNPPFGSGESWWIVDGADTEITAVPTDLGHANFGTWIAHNGAWAFSMPDLSDLTHADMSVPQYRFGVKDGASLDAITGGRGAELFSFFWPLTPFTLTLSRP